MTRCPVGVCAPPFPVEPGDTWTCERCDRTWTAYAPTAQAVVTVLSAPPPEWWQAAPSLT